MSKKQSPWARPGGVDTSPGQPVFPPPPPPVPAKAEPLIDLGPGWSRSGAVTQLGVEAPSAPEEAPERATHRRTLMWFAGGAGLILAVGLVILLAMALTGNGPLVNRPSGPSNYAPPLAKACRRPRPTRRSCRRLRHRHPARAPSIRIRG